MFVKFGNRYVFVSLYFQIAVIEHLLQLIDNLRAPFNDLSVLHISAHPKFFLLGGDGKVNVHSCCFRCESQSAAEMTDVPK